MSLRIIILLIVSNFQNSLTIEISSAFNIQSNKNVTSQFSQSYSMASFYKIRKMNCLTECNKDNKCSVAVYDQNNQSCYLFNGHLNHSTDTMNAQSMNVFNKKSIIILFKSELKCI